MRTIKSINRMAASITPLQFQSIRFTSHNAQRGMLQRNIADNRTLPSRRMIAIGTFIGINTTPRYLLRTSPYGGGKTGVVSTRPDALYGNNIGNATTILEIYEQTI